MGELTPLSQILPRPQHPNGSSMQIDGDKSTMLPTPSDRVVCPTCDGRGWIRQGSPLGHPDFGKIFPCDCAYTDRAMAALARAVGEMALPSMRFDRFSLARNPSMAVALRVSKKWSQGQGAPWLLLLGRPGCGKTMLAVAAAQAHIAGRRWVVFRHTADFFNGLRKQIKAEAEGEASMQEMLEHTMGVEVLILDDVGVQQQTPWEQETIDTLLNYRYQRGKWTMLTSNNLSMVGARISSRLSDGSVCRVVWCKEAKDVRPTLGR